MKYFYMVLAVGILYGICGLVMAWYEKSQTDDEFKIETIITWLPKVLGIKI